MNTKVKKLKETSETLINNNILEVQAYDCFEKVKATGRAIINSYTTGLENRILKKLLINLVPDYTINVKDKRRAIARYLIENNSFSIN